MSKRHLLKRHSVKDRCLRHPQSRSTGFTLVEVLVVLAIIGLIVGLMGPRVLGFLADSKTKTAHIQVESLASAVDLFYLDNGRYPTSSEGLAALTDKPGDTPAWNGPYLKGNKVPNDPWGRPFVYRMPGKTGPYDILAAGSEGTVADIDLGGKPDPLPR